MSKLTEFGLNNLEFNAVCRSQITSVVINEIRVAQFEVIEIYKIAIEIRSGVPSSHVEFDKAISGNAESGEFGDRWTRCVTRGRNNDQPFFAFERTEALGTLLMARDFVKLSPALLEPHDVEAGDAVLKLELGIFSIEVFPIDQGLDQLPKGAKCFSGN